MLSWNLSTCTVFLLKGDTRLHDLIKTKTKRGFYLCKLIYQAQYVICNISSVWKPFFNFLQLQAVYWIPHGFVHTCLHPLLVSLSTFRTSKLYQEKMLQEYLLRNKVFGKYAFQETNTSKLNMVKNFTSASKLQGLHEGQNKGISYLAG